MDACEEQIKMLDYLYNNKGIATRGKLINIRGRIDGDNALNSLEKLKLVVENGNNIEITAEGYRMLLDFELAANKHCYQYAKNSNENYLNVLQANVAKEKQFRHDFLITTFNVLLVYILNHFPETVDFIKSLFH